MNLIYRLLFTLLSLLSVISDSLSQQQNKDTQGNIGTTRTDSIPTGIMPLDTAVPVSYVLIGNDKKIYIEDDTATWEKFNGHPLGFGYAHFR